MLIFEFSWRSDQYCKSYVEIDYIRMSMAFVASLCLFEIFDLWVWCVSALVLLFVPLLCHETSDVAMMKLWWFCQRLLYRKPWAVPFFSPSARRKMDMIFFHFLDQNPVTHCLLREIGSKFVFFFVTVLGIANEPYRAHACTTSTDIQNAFALKMKNIITKIYIAVLPNHISTFHNRNHYPRREP